MYIVDIFILKNNYINGKRKREKKKPSIWNWLNIHIFYLFRKTDYSEKKNWVIFLVFKMI